MLLGAHVSIAESVSRAPERGKAIGCESIQIFSKNQRQWSAKPFARDDIDGFREGLKRCDIKVAIIHDSYLINLASPRPDLLEKSIASFSHEVERAAALGIRYLVFHPGSHTGSGEKRGLATIAGSLYRVHEGTKGLDVITLLETAAGQGTNLGHRFEQLREIMDMVEDKRRVGVCYDTCHTFAAGYDIRTEEDYEKVIEALDEAVSLKNVKAFHLNDSKGPLGSMLDRHEHIGKGELGLEPFRLIVNDRRFGSIPGCLETPGDESDFERNLKVLKSLRGLESTGKKVYKF
jgi:deoxyribonuclease-4